MATHIWTGGGTTPNWDDLANWSDGVEPGPVDNKEFDQSAEVNFDFPLAANSGTITIGAGEVSFNADTQPAAPSSSGAPAYTQIGTLVNEGLVLVDPGATFTFKAATLKNTGTIALQENA